MNALGLVSESVSCDAEMKGDTRSMSSESSSSTSDLPFRIIQGDNDELWLGEELSRNGDLVTIAWWDRGAKKPSKDLSGRYYPCWEDTKLPIRHTDVINASAILISNFKLTSGDTIPESVRNDAIVALSKRKTLLSLCEFHEVCLSCRAPGPTPCESCRSTNALDKVVR